MALFKCKMCGGDLEIAEGVTIAECEYCGTKQTVPKAMDENLQNLFNRANTLRMKSEFDKAEKLYEKIIQADSTQSEAYWGLILCKYGIEYVDDPKTYKKIPTCHRASYDSIIADDDYKSAIENADMSQRILYEEQAKEIDRIQKDILALAQNEETYDVFICYKETDTSGKRTQDSVIANDIYHQLTQEGFKVFYAAITLEGKLGSAYEPIIFAALNSAKVMLAIGTKPEYFNAVWVKNEWSRYLKIIKSDRSKLLIPCYRDMDAYELPEEFAHLQAQDMGKIGFINDIVRGIKKVITKDEPKPQTVVKETIVTTAASANTAPLLKRAYMFLEDGDWDSANEYCEKVLDIDPECADAYLGKFMSSCHIKTRTAIPNTFGKSSFLKQHADFQKAMRFADESLRAELNGYIQSIENERQTGQRVASKSEIKKGTTHIVITQNVKDEAFKECTTIETVTVLEGVTNIGTCAFMGCTGLTSITLPNSITSIGIGAFLGCTGLKSITIPDSVTSICDGAFQDCTSLVTVTIPDSVSLIGDWAFYRCAELSSIAIGNNVSKIGRCAFAECPAITNISIPDSVTQMDIGVFENCHSLQSAKVGTGLTKLPTYTFNFCYKLTSVTIPHGIKSIDEAAFQECQSLSKITIPPSVKNIERIAFLNCISLKSITIPDSVTSIGEGAFQGCTSLSTAILGNGLTRIDRCAFYNCSVLSNVVIPPKVQTIPEGIFQDCVKLNTITIPSSVTSIDSWAFFHCWDLTIIYHGTKRQWKAIRLADNWRPPMGYSIKYS